MPCLLECQALPVRRGSRRRRSPRSHFARPGTSISRTKRASGGGDTTAQMAYASVSDPFHRTSHRDFKHTQLLSRTGSGSTRQTSANSITGSASDHGDRHGGLQWTGEKRRRPCRPRDPDREEHGPHLRYEIENAASGQRMQSLIGLNHQWSPRKDLKLTGGPSGIDYLKGGERSAEGIALAPGRRVHPREGRQGDRRPRCGSGRTRRPPVFPRGRDQADAGFRPPRAGEPLEREPRSGRRARTTRWRACVPAEGGRSIYLLDTIRFVRNGTRCPSGGARVERLVTSNEIS